jgi:hypothetical protein
MAKFSWALSRRWKASLDGNTIVSLFPNSPIDPNGKRRAGLRELGVLVAHPSPPVLGGAPVSPSAMARAVVVKVARRGRIAAVLVKTGRSILGGGVCGDLEGCFCVVWKGGRMVK